MYTSELEITPRGTAELVQSQNQSILSSLGKYSTQGQSGPLLSDRFELAATYSWYQAEGLDPVRAHVPQSVNLLMTYSPHALPPPAV